MKRLKKILSGVLNISEDSITDETAPENVENWDSFNALVLVSELENHFGIKFTMKEVTSVKCVGDIKGCLKKHGVVLKDE